MAITLEPTLTEQAAASGMRQAASVTDMGGAVFGNAYSAHGDGQNDYNRTVEQLRAYHGWTYVVVRKACELVAGQTPSVGMIDRQQMPDGRQRLMGWHDRQRWSERYGAIYQVSAENVNVLDSHPLIALMEYVNDDDTWSDFAFELNLYLELCGCAYVWCVPSQFLLPTGVPMPAQLVVVPTQSVTEKRAKNGERIGWEIDIEGGQPMLLGPQEIIPFRFKSPISKRGWTSPTQATDVWHDGSMGIGRSRVATMANQGNPSLILKPDPEKWGEISDDEARALSARIANRARSLKQHGQPLVLPPAVDAERWSDKVSEMSYIESDEQLRDALFAARGLSKFVVGLTKDMNRSDVEAAMAQACEFSINPRLMFIAGRLTEKLAKRWDPNLLVWFPDCTPRSWERELEENKLDAATGALTPGERRAARGRDEIKRPEMEVPLVASSTLPLWSDVEDDEGNTRDEDDEDQNQHSAGELF